MNTAPWRRLGHLGGFLICLLLFASCASSATNKSTVDLAHFSKSIAYANQAARVINKSSSFAVMSEEDTRAMIAYHKDALKEARLVDIAELNRYYPAFGDHFRDEFLKGVELFVQGAETVDGRMSLQGQVLLDKWGRWYGQNIDAIRKR